MVGHYDINNKGMHDFFQFAWYNGLSGDSVSTVIHHHGAQSKQTFCIYTGIGSHTLQIIALKYRVNYFVKITKIRASSRLTLSE